MFLSHFGEVFTVCFRSFVERELTSSRSTLSQCVVMLRCQIALDCCCFWVKQNENGCDFKIIKRMMTRVCPFFCPFVCQSEMYKIQAICYLLSTASLSDVSTSDCYCCFRQANIWIYNKRASK